MILMSFFELYVVIRYFNGFTIQTYDEHNDNYVFIYLYKINKEIITK